MSGNNSESLFVHIKGVPGRGWLYVFTCIATVIGIQLLYLANDDLFLNLALSSAVVLGFVFSYNLYAGYHRFVIVLLDIIAISIFGYYITKVLSNPQTWGTDLGVLLGMLVTLYSFRAFTERDHRMILAASLVILLLSSVASYDVKLMFILPFFVFCGFASLYISNNLSLSERIPFLASELGAAASIIYLAGRATFAVLAASIFIYMIVPHSTTVRNPRFRLPTSNILTNYEEEDIPLLEREQIDQRSSSSGFSDQFDLSQGGRVNIKDEPVLLVRSTLNDYMRGKVFDVYDGVKWKQSQLADYTHRPRFTEAEMEKIKKGIPVSGIMGNVEPLPLVDFPSIALKNTFSKRYIYVMDRNIYSSQSMAEFTDLKYTTQHLEVTFLKNYVAVFFSPYQAFRVEDVSPRKERTPGDNDRYADPVIDSFSIVNAARNEEYMAYFPKDIHYKLLVLKPSILPAKLRESPNNVPKEIRDHYTQLPQTINKLEPERDPLVKLAQTVAAGSGSVPATLPYDKVVNIYDYFVNSGEFEYSLEYPKLPMKKVRRTDPQTGETVEVEVPEMDAAYHFVFKSKKGYCEYFANAFAVFCRINDIPTRVVTGFAPGRYDFIRNGFVVSTKNAHAWTEVYFDGFGWVAFDPTPASSDFLSTGEIKGFFTAIFDYVQNLFVIDPRGVQEATKLFFVTLAKRIYEVAVDNSVTSSGILTMLTGFLIWSIWRRRPKREQPHIPKNDVVRAFYEIESMLKHFGYFRSPHQTGRTYLRQVAMSARGLSVTLSEFAEIYYHYAFSKEEPNDIIVKNAEATVEAVRKYLERKTKDKEPNNDK